MLNNISKYKFIGKLIKYDMLIFFREPFFALPILALPAFFFIVYINAYGKTVSLDEFVVIESSLEVIIRINLRGARLIPLTCCI